LISFKRSSRLFREKGSESWICKNCTLPRRGHPLPAADNFLPERDPGSACRHG
ncbi:unnamed protein product, partial [Ascophyllum nodosum]